MKTKNIVFLVLAIVVAVAALALIIVGVATHEETGLLQVCWNAEDDAEYQLGEIDTAEGAPAASCAHPEDLVWPQKQIPIRVAISDFRGDRTGTRAVEAAIDDINRQLGFTLFVPVQTDFAVNLHIGVPHEAGRPLGTTSHSKSEDGLYSEVMIYSTVGSERMAYLVAHHELLHVAGLGHDDFPDSAIYPFTEDDSMLDQMAAARITDFDVALLRGLYNSSSD